MTLSENPFYVMGLSVDASRIEIEREAAKLLGMLELGFADVKTYATPLGPRPRTPELVRAAAAALRDPYQRLVAEIWARNAPAPTTVAADEPEVIATTHPGARKQLGWRP
ncbi:MAG: hypothetical protein QM831_45050 [Kofleriaceae bacterium]